MIVNKPQFDLTKIKVGQAFMLTKSDMRRYQEWTEACLISKVEPLKISVKLFMEDRRGGEKELTSLDISIDSVVRGTYKFEKMVVEPQALEEQ